MIDPIREQWTLAFPNVPPVAHRFRDRLSSRWFRIHTLPESKRYPQSEVEYQCVLDRHTTLLRELGDVSDAILILPLISNTEDRAVNDELRDVFAPFKYWRSLAPFEIGDDFVEGTHVHLYELRAPFPDGALDRVFRCVADDRVFGVFLVNTVAGWLYHPYDGGADIIAPSETAAGALKERHGAWLSRHPSGL